MIANEPMKSPSLRRTPVFQGQGISLLNMLEQSAEASYQGSDRLAEDEAPPRQVCRSILPRCVDLENDHDLKLLQVHIPPLQLRGEMNVSPLRRDKSGPSFGQKMAVLVLGCAALFAVCMLINAEGSSNVRECVLVISQLGRATASSRSFSMCCAANLHLIDNCMLSPLSACRTTSSGETTTSTPPWRPRP